MTTYPSEDELRDLWTFIKENKPEVYEEWQKTGETYDCPVCMETISDKKQIIQCPNDHVAACKSCVKRMIGLGMNRNCPVCRESNVLCIKLKILHLMIHL